MRLFYRARDLRVSAGAARSESPHFRIALITQHLAAVVCLRVHYRIGTVSGPPYI